MLEALETLCLLIDFYTRASMFLNPEEFENSRNLGKRFFKAYAWLNKRALAKGKQMFHIVMKFHAMHHLIRNRRFINPRFTCNWKAEDFAGQVARLSHSVTSGVRSTKMSTKIIPKYGVLLHLQLTRPGFSQETIYDAE